MSLLCRCALAEIFSDSWRGGLPCLARAFLINMNRRFSRLVRRYALAGWAAAARKRNPATTTAMKRITRYQRVLGIIILLNGVGDGRLYSKANVSSEVRQIPVM